MARIFITGSANGLGLMEARLLVSQGHQVIRGISPGTLNSSSYDSDEEKAAENYFQRLFDCLISAASVVHYY